MRPSTLVLAIALAAPLAALAQNPMQRQSPRLAASPPAVATASPPADATPIQPAIGPSPTSGSDAGPFPPLRDHGVVLNPAVIPAPTPVVEMPVPVLTAEDTELLAMLRRERAAREERELARVEREAERNAQRLAQQPQPIVKPWPYN